MNNVRQKSFGLLACLLLVLAAVWASSRVSLLRKSLQKSQPGNITSSAKQLSRSSSALVNSQTGLAIDQAVIAGGGGTSTGGSIRIEGTVGQATAGTSSTSSNGRFSLTGGFWQAVAGAASTPSPTPTPIATPTPTPNPIPTIFIEEGTANKAVALDSVTFVRGPFRLVDDHNFSADHRTRVILFTSFLGLSQPNPAVLTVQAAGFDLPVEDVGTFTGVSGLNASYIVVRLPDGLPSGDLPLTVTFNGNVSNIAILSISP